MSRPGNLLPQVFTLLPPSSMNIKVTTFVLVEKCFTDLRCSLIFDSHQNSHGSYDTRTILWQHWVGNVGLELPGFWKTVENATSVLLHQTLSTPLTEKEQHSHPT